MCSIHLAIKGMHVAWGICVRLYLYWKCYSILSYCVCVCQICDSGALTLFSVTHSVGVVFLLTTLKQSLFTLASKANVK